MHMANPFYSRYVPQNLIIESSRPGKKRKIGVDTSLSESVADTLTKTQDSTKAEAKGVGSDKQVPDHKTQKNEVAKTTYLRPSPERTINPKSTKSTNVVSIPIKEPSIIKERQEKGINDWQTNGSGLPNRRAETEESYKPKQSSRQTPGPQLQESLGSDGDVKHKKVRDKWKRSLDRSIQQKTGQHATTREDGRILGPGDQGNTSREDHGLVPLPQPTQEPDSDIKAKLLALPEWLRNPTVVSSSGTSSLDQLPLSASIVKSLRNKGIHSAFPVQAAVANLLIPGPQQYPGDLCISASTGSGKTLAYALPMIENLRGKPTTRLRGLIVVPTRELVLQARETLDMCAVESGLRIAMAVGHRPLHEEQKLFIESDQKYDPEGYRNEQCKFNDEDEELLNWDFESLLEKGPESDCLVNYVIEYKSKIDILICTPGRLVEHMQNTTGFTLKYVQWLIVDEADRLLDESFQQWIDIVMPALEYQVPLNPIEQQLAKTFHHIRQRYVQKIILSATMTKDIGKITSLKLRCPKLLVLEDSIGNPEDWHERHPDESSQLLHEEILLPPYLKEVAFAIADVGEKPLHLLKLLEYDNVKSNPVIDKSSSRNLAPCDTPRENQQSSKGGHSGDSDNSPGSFPTKSLLSTDDVESTCLSPREKKKTIQPTLSALIFVKNNENALRLARLLALIEPSLASRIGTLTKSSAGSSSRKLLAKFRQGKLMILIASDRASRGLDIPDLKQVINYDMPSSITSYIHRIGRTARAGKVGLAMTLVAHHEARWFWKEIAKSEKIVRGAEKKVAKVESKSQNIEEELRQRYENALKVLGEEAKGERHDEQRTQRKSKSST